MSCSKSYKLYQRIPGTFVKLLRIIVAIKMTLYFERKIRS